MSLRFVKEGNNVRAYNYFGYRVFPHELNEIFPQRNAVGQSEERYILNALANFKDWAYSHLKVEHSRQVSKSLKANRRRK